MYENAIKKIDKEAEKMKSQSAMRIADYVIKLINCEHNAQAVMNKTLSDVLSEINKRARKEAVKNCAMIEDEVVFSWVVEIYGLKTDSQAQSDGTGDGIVNLLDCM